MPLSKETENNLVKDHLLILVWKTHEEGTNNNNDK